MTRAPWSIMRAASVVACLLAPLGCAGAGRGASAAAQPPAFEPAQQTKCSVTKSQAKPLIVEWPSSERGALESMVRQGVVPVRYEGCEMEVLSNCRGAGRYRYAPITRKKERIVIRDADDLYTNVPLGAAKLEATLEKTGQLDVAMTIVGRYEAEGGAGGTGDLVGRDCARATHVITAATVGSFEFSAGADARVGGGASGFGVGAGGASRAQRQVITWDGEEQACRRATSADKRPPDGCGAFLRLEVEPLSKPSGTAAMGSTGEDCPAGMHRRGETCVPTVGGDPSSSLGGSVLTRFEPPDPGVWSLKERAGNATRFLCTGPCSAVVRKDTKLVVTRGDDELDAPSLAKLPDGANATLLVAPSRGSVGGSTTFLVIGGVALVTGIVLAAFPAHWDPKLRIPRGQVVAAASIVSPKY